MYTHHNPQHQSGAVLVVSLIMLLLLTIIGVTGVQSTSLEEKMAGNLRDKNLAFQAAESALLAGETATAAAPTIACPPVTTPNPVGYYLPLDVNCDGTKETTPIWDNATIWSDDTKSVKYNTDSDPATIDLANLSANPRYIIEDIGMICTTAALPCPASNKKKTYRVTSRAVGGSTNAVVIVQSIYTP